MNIGQQPPMQQPTRNLPRWTVMCLAISLASFVWGAESRNAESRNADGRDSDSQGAVRSDAIERPNVIIFFLDDSGYGDVAHNGNPVIETPNISRLAALGTSFTQFYVTSPACSASRYSLLTGRYPARSGFGRWVIGPGAKQHLHRDETTIAEGLKSVGYATGMFGKWHLGNPNPANEMSAEAFPCSHGFDTWIGTNVSHDYGNAKLIRSWPDGHTPISGYEEIATNLPSNPQASRSLTGRYTRAAVEFIHQNKSQPFFAYIAHNQPHLGLYVSEDFAGTSRRGLLGDVMAEVDDSVGQVLQAIEDARVADKTMIVFASDNGPWVMFRNTKNHPKYGEARSHVGYAWPFRDGKGSNWEGGHRVPGIFYWPGVIGANRQLEPASTLDVLPTVFAYAGVPLPTDRKLDGRDIRSLLASERDSVSTDSAFSDDEFEIVYSDSKNNPAAIRAGPWKLHIRTSSQTGNDYGFKASRKSPLLFNVEQDFGERIDRAKEHPEIVKRLLERLQEIEQSLAD